MQQDALERLNSGIFGAVLASIPTLSTHMVVYDTAVVDLTDDLQDPVDLSFGTQLGAATTLRAHVRAASRSSPGRRRRSWS
jgi:hypothetical protein